MPNIDMPKISPSDADCRGFHKHLVFSIQVTTSEWRGGLVIDTRQ
jgi:hypothetical protein